MSLLGLALTCSSCGDSTSTTELIPVAIESQDKIVSEDVDLESVAAVDSVRAISTRVVTGDTEFPEGSRAVTEASEVDLHLLLRGMFFYLTPLSDAVDGVYTAGEDHRDFLTMDLIGMFDLRVLP